MKKKIIKLNAPIEKGGEAHRRSIQNRLYKEALYGLCIIILAILSITSIIHWLFF